MVSSSKRRAGTRFNRRGVSRDGQAANFVETEQILCVEAGAGGQPATMEAYVQTRGSVPALWAQPVDLQYNPPMLFVDDLSMQSRTAFKRHVVIGHL